MKYYILLALKLFFLTHLSATVQPTIAQVKNYAKKTSWAFEENKGQVTGSDRKKVKYFYKQGRTSVFLMKNRIAYQFEEFTYPQGYKELLKGDQPDYLDSIEKLSKKIKRESYRMDIELVGGNKNCEIITEGKSPDYIQYYNHNALDVHSYQKITYKNIYPNIDWVIYQSKVESKKSQAEANFPLSTLDFGLKYDFIVHPGGDPSLIKLRTHWVEDLSIKPDGSLTLVNRMGSITEKPPVSFQLGKEISTNFKLKDKTISFRVADYDKTQTLVIDPEVAWSTYYGGSENDLINDCQTDNLGNVYLAGSTDSRSNISYGGYQVVYGGDPGGVGFGTGDAILVKFNTNGKRIWATYFGGSGTDVARSCSIDSKNNVYICGSTNSSGLYFNGFQNLSTSNSFFAKFSPSGSRIWCSSYFACFLESIHLDYMDNIILSGSLGSTVQTGFILNAHQPTHGGTSAHDYFLAKFDSNSTRLFCTYYGGSGAEVGMNFSRTDSEGNIYMVGRTRSTNNIAFNGLYNTHSPTVGGFYQYDGFLVKFSPSGVRQWGSYLGNMQKAHHIDEVHSIAIDRGGNIILGGRFRDTSLLTIKGSTQDTMPFLIKFNPMGQLEWGRGYFVSDCPWYEFQGKAYVVSDSQNNIYIHAHALCDAASSLDSVFYLGLNNEFSKNIGVLKFDKDGKRIWGFNYGGAGYDLPSAMAISKAGDLYIAGITDTIARLTPTPKVSTNLGKKGHQMSYSGKNDGYLAKICQHTDTAKITISSNRGTSICGGGQVIFTATDTFEGDDPVYTWYKNGNPIGMDTNILIMATIQDKDSFRCRLISSATCLLKDTVWSNTIVMNIRAADTTHIYDSTICELSTYWFNGQNIGVSGLYRDTFVSSAGCDSFVFLHLKFKDTSYHVFSHSTPCDPNASFMFNGLARTQSGTYSAKYLNAVGCDSTAVLNLTIRKPSTPFTFTQYICPGTSYFFNGQPRTTANTHTQIFTNTQGCDSSVTLDLRVLNSPRPEQNPIAACAPFTFRGKTYNSSATIIDTIKTLNGLCDSIFLSNILQLKPPATTLADSTVIICDSIRLNNRLYTNSFSFIDTFRSSGAVQCDSAYRKTNYTIRYTPKLGLKERDTFIRGAQVTLKPFTANNYLWSTGQTTKDISFKLTEDRQLYLIAWNEEPCRDTAYISLVAEDLAIMGMPTGFSPNGEHPENRTLRPNVNGRLERFHMMVFNRWGEKVYETFDTNPIGWNGIYRSEPAPAGLYSYIIEYRTLGRIYTKSGEVMLVW